MADRTSAELFSMFFEHLAENPDLRAKALAVKLWHRTYEYDFNSYQMDCDAALLALDLAERIDGSIHYGPPGDRHA